MLGRVAALNPGGGLNRVEDSLVEAEDAIATARARTADADREAAEEACRSSLTISATGQGFQWHSP